MKKLYKAGSEVVSKFLYNGPEQTNAPQETAARSKDLGQLREDVKIELGKLEGLASVNFMSIFSNDIKQEDKDFILGTPVNELFDSNGKITPKLKRKFDSANWLEHKSDDFTDWLNSDGAGFRYLIGKVFEKGQDSRTLQDLSGNKKNVAKVDSATVASTAPVTTVPGKAATTAKNESTTAVTTLEGNLNLIRNKYRSVQGFSLTEKSGILTLDSQGSSTAINLKEFTKDGKVDGTKLDLEVKSTIGQHTERAAERAKAEIEKAAKQAKINEYKHIHDTNGANLSSDKIKKIQKHLNVPVDGTWGPVTKGAVGKFVSETQAQVSASPKPQKKPAQVHLPKLGKKAPKTADGSQEVNDYVDDKGKLSPHEQQAVQRDVNAVLKTLDKAKPILVDGKIGGDTRTAAKKIGVLRENGIIDFALLQEKAQAARQKVNLEKSTEAIQTVDKQGRAKIDSLLASIDENNINQVVEELIQFTDVGINDSEHNYKEVDDKGQKKLRDVRTARAQYIVDQLGAKQEDKFVADVAERILQTEKFAKFPSPRAIDKMLGTLGQLKEQSGDENLNNSRRVEIQARIGNVKDVRKRILASNQKMDVGDALEEGVFKVQGREYDIDRGEDVYVVTGSGLLKTSLAQSGAYDLKNVTIYKNMIVGLMDNGCNGNVVMIPLDDYVRPVKKRKPKKVVRRRKQKQKNKKLAQTRKKPDCANPTKINIKGGATCGTEGKPINGGNPSTPGGGRGNKSEGNTGGSSAPSGGLST